MMPGGHGISIKMKGKTIKTMISEERIREVFTELVAIDSESFSEKEIGENVTRRLRKLGLDVITDGSTDPAFHSRVYPPERSEKMRRTDTETDDD